MHARNRRLAWLIGLGMSAALFALIALFFDWRYSQNDDVAIMRSFMGFETGTPASFHIFVHGLLARPIHWLALRFPTVAWFSVFQVGLLFLGSVVLQKSMIQCALKTGAGLASGSLLALVGWLLFVFPYCVRVTFTQTAAILGAAAAMQIMSLEHDKPAVVVRGMLLATLLAVLAYALRQDALAPVLAFCGVAFVFVFCTEYGLGGASKRAARPMLVSLLVAAVALGGMLGWRAAETARCGDADYLAWQEVRTLLLDQYGIDNLPGEALEAVGWSPNMASLVSSQWFFLDESVSTEAFEQLNRYMETTPMASMEAWLKNGAEVLKRFPRDNPDLLPQLWTLVALLAACLAGIALMGRGRRGWLLFAVAGMALLAAAMLVYLAVMKGRLPSRAALQALLPLAAALMALLPACLEGRAAGRLGCAALAIQLGLCGWYLVTAVPRFAAELTEERADGVTDMLSYALSEEDMFIIHDLTLSGDRNLFPDTSEGQPHNVSFWGGWELRSACSIEQFANHGIDLLHFDPAVFLREDVLFASAVVDPPPNQLLAYLREKVDPGVDYMIYGENGYAYFFQFYVP